MAKSRGHKNAHSRAGHKGKNKKTAHGRFAPLMEPWEYDKMFGHRHKKQKNPNPTFATPQEALAYEKNRRNKI